MFELDFCQGGVFVYDVDVWITLRKMYRILGELIGNTNFVQTLPSKLLSEEALLLLEKGIAKVIDRKYCNASDINEKYEQFENDLLCQQQIIYRNKRKKQLESMIEDIVTAKRKRGDNRSSEEILNDELDKSCKVTKENMIWPILLKPICPFDSFTEISRDEILKSTSELKYAVYKDLWETGYYITSGHKFGGDFLVYLGDPIIYHAIFIVRCITDENHLIPPTEIVAFGRLATSVKKRAVLASLNKDKHVSYITINWIDA